MSIWQIILTGLGGSAILAWLVKKIITHFLDKDVQAYKIRLQAISDQKLESFKTELRLIEYRSTKLHEKRAGVIENIYQKLIKTDKLADKFISSAGRVSKAELQILACEATSCRDDFHEYFKNNQIYFDEQLCKKISDFDDSLVALMIRVEAPNAFTDATSLEMLKAKDESLQKLMTQAHPIRDELAKQFRLILGVIEKP